MEEPQGTPGVPQQAPPQGVSGPCLELRVHGVGGATPQEMLGDPCVTRITGDETAAVYRRTADVDAEDHLGDATDRPVTEAYCWSHLTSGNSLRALWLLLLPFMVVNLVHWMLPGTGGRTTGRLYGVLVRLLALSLTVLLVAAACEVALDLVAWQCGGSPACVGAHAWLGFLGQPPAGRGTAGGWWSLPGRRLALAAAVPVALVALLWWLSHRTWNAYESQPPLVRPQGGPDGPALALPGFWYGRRLVARLRAAHTAAGLLTVAAALTFATAGADRAPGGDAALETVGYLIQALLALAAGCVVWTVCRRGRSERRTDDRDDRVTTLLLPSGAAVLLVAAVVHAAWFRPGRRSSGLLPADETFGVLTVVQGLLVAGLAVIGALRCREAAARGTVLRGLGGAAAAMPACFLGGMLSGGVAQRVADWLDPGTAGPGGGRLHGPPTLLTWQASAIPVLLAVLLLAGCLFLLRVRRRTRALAPTVCEQYPGAVHDASRSRHIAAAVARAELTDSAPLLLGSLSLTALLLGLAGVLGTWLTGRTPARAADGAPAVVDGLAGTVQALGSWLLGLAFLLFLALGRRAYRDVSARRTVGILWDVGTFWPRAAHPFAPPCYAERAVPDLAWRMAAWTELRPGGRLVISGHSQGSVLAAAAVWQLDARTRRQIALLTYGSPLARLYGRWFPAYFDHGALTGLHRELDRWRNLWRRTDPIGGPVHLADVDRGPLPDPLAYARTLRLPLPTPVLAHSDYQRDPAFEEERSRLLARCRPSRRARAQAQKGPGRSSP